jgi:methyl-accepting chemotaxis protein
MLKNRPFLQKLVLAFGLVGVFFLGSMITTQVAMSQMRSAEEKVAEQGINQLKLGQSLLIWVRTTDVDGGYYLLNGNTEFLQRSQADATQVAQIEKQIRSYPLTAEQEKALGQFDSQWKMYLLGDQSAISQYQQGDKAGGQYSFANAYPGPLIDATTNYVQSVVQAVDQQKQSMQQVSSMATMLTFIVSALAIICGAVLVILLTRNVVPPLHAMVKVAKRVADGDISSMDDIAARYRGKDEVGQLVNAFQLMVTSQQEMVAIAQQIAIGNLTPIDDLVAPYEERPESGILLKALRQMVNQLRHVVGQLHHASFNMGDAASQITSVMEQTGGAVSQVAHTIQEVAIGAQQQTRLLSTLRSDSIETMNDMETLKEQVNVTAERVRRLGKRSDDVGRIVATIDELAAQTNLLALNAAIEAARAGIHGRGFAVVASEVRKLAERSTQAVQEIESIITENQEETTQAVKVMERGVTQVEEGVNRARTAEEHAQSIATVSEENSASAEEVACAAEEMSAQVEETIAATSQLTVLSRELAEIASKFTLEEEAISNARAEHTQTPVWKEAA